MNTNYKFLLDLVSQARPFTQLLRWEKFWNFHQKCFVSYKCDLKNFVQDSTLDKTKAPAGYHYLNIPIFPPLLSLTL